MFLEASAMDMLKAKLSESKEIRDIMQAPRALRRLWVYLYILVYLPWFFGLEKVVTEYYLIECRLDYMIPFCEYFIVPYLFWFVYIAATFLWFHIYEDDRLFYRLCTVMFGGMTIALIIYTIFPNGIQIRPEIDASKNVFTWLTAMIYSSDTSANVFPSLHVYESCIAAAFFAKSDLAKRHPSVKYVNYIIAMLIVLSTVFLKQHSVLDLLAGVIMAWGLTWAAFIDETAAEKRVGSKEHSLVVRW